MKNVMKNAVIKLLIFMFAVNANARIDKGLNGQIVSGFSQQQFLSIMNNSSQEARKTLQEELLGVEGPAANWPGFPRTWTQFKETTFQNTNTSLGLTVNAISQNLGLGALTSTLNLGVTAKPYQIDYQYTFDTTLVVVSSYRPATPIKEGEKPIVSADDAGVLHTVYDLDPKTNKNFFKVSPSHPVVGFCIIEATLRVATSSEYGVKYFVGESSATSGKAKTISHALYSNFFQIESHVPVEDYQQVKCGQAFQKLARPYVEADFNKLVIELNIHNNPKNECIVETDGRPEGDNNCLAWHKKFDSATQKMTVPRCIMGKKGVARCELRSKKDMPCPMYVDRQGNYTDKFQLYRDATLSNFGFSCDEKQKCQMESEPWTLFNKALILFPGRAYCR